MALQHFRQKTPSKRKLIEEIQNLEAKLEMLGMQLQESNAVLLAILLEAEAEGLEKALKISSEAKTDARHILEKRSKMIQVSAEDPEFNIHIYLINRDEKNNEHKAEKATDEG